MRFTGLDQSAARRVATGLFARVAMLESSGTTDDLAEANRLKALAHLALDTAVADPGRASFFPYGSS